MIDLHSHTTASDGQHSATELIQKAKEAGVRTLAVTDHDTVASLAEASRAAREAGLELVNGIELSAFVNGKETHILGHFVDPAEPALQGLSTLLRTEREKRMHKMVARLAELGMPVEFDEVVRASGGENLGRPHLAQVLMAHGWAKDVRDAFEKHIGAGKPGYVQRYKLSSAEAIALIRKSGGAATVAHLAVNKLTRADLTVLKEEGLAGLEVAHPDHPAHTRDHVLQLAREFDLVPTAGSDFHGEAIVPGRRLGMVEMAADDLERLRARAARRNEGEAHV
ncbi:MAG: PHP domain-containing protein [Myxococcales bacterium]